MHVLNTTYYEGLDKVVETFFECLQAQQDGTWPARKWPAPPAPEVLLIDYAKNPTSPSFHRSFALLRDVVQPPPSSPDQGRIGLMRLSVVRKDHLFVSHIQQLAVSAHDGVLPQEIVRLLAEGILYAPGFSTLRAAVRFHEGHDGPLRVADENGELKVVAFPEVEVRVLDRAPPGAGKRKKLLDAIFSERRLSTRKRNLETLLSDLTTEVEEKKRAYAKTCSDLRGTSKVVAALKKELNFHANTLED